MKKIIYILAALLLVATACSRIDLSPAEQDGDRITFTMNLNVPVRSIGTKAVGDTPGALNVYVLVFGSNGNLNDFVQALPTGTGGFVEDPSTHHYSKEYAISLKMTDSEQHVHVIATNDEITLDDLLKGGTNVNESIMDELQTGKTDEGIFEDGYWQYLPLPNGTNGQGAATAFNNLKLVRNFAKITLEFADEEDEDESKRLSLPEGVSNFEYLGFEVYNKPVSASYVIKKDNEYYPEYATKDANDFEELLANYPGYMIDETDIDTENAGKFPEGDEDGKVVDYLYERTVSSINNNPTYLIVKCLYDDAAVEGDDKRVTRYYRIDLVDQNENYLPIYRNFLYALRITRIGKKGYASIEEAAQHSSNGNISMDPATQDLEDISDGASRLLVQYIEKVFVTSTQAQTGTFRYKYLKDAENEETSSAATLTVPDNTAISVPTNWTAGGTPNTDDHWYDLSFTIAANAPTSSSSFTVTGVNDNNKKLVRRVRIRILPKQNFTITAQPATIALNGTATIKFRFDDADFKDADGNFIGFPSSMFPIEMLFEDTANALNPDHAADDGKDMTASGGLSLVPNTNVNAVQFKKTISYDEYVKSFTTSGGTTTSGEFSATFKRIANGTTNLYIGNQYFVTESITNIQ